MTAEKIKLNLGSRNRTLPGFKNMDCDPHPGVDFVGDVSDLSRFANGEIDEIYASHVLEHFPSDKTLPVLKEWGRVLKTNGILYVAVPDFRRAVELYLRLGLNDWVQNYLWGDQHYPTAFHYAGFDEQKLTRLLSGAGFCDVQKVGQFDLGQDDCSTHVSTWDHKSVSLNMRAIK